MATIAAQLQPSAAAPADPAPPLSRAASVILLLRFGVVMAGLLALASLPASSLFTVRGLRVQGALRLSPQEIAILAAVRPGDRLAAVTPEEIRRRVLRHPRVAEAAVTIGRPGIVTIRVRERTPYAAFPLDGRFLILDRTGVILAEEASPLGLPLVAVAGFTPEWIRLGDRLPSAGVERALAALARLPRAVVTPGTRVRADPGGDVVLFTPDGIAVRLGALRGLEERAAMMHEVLAALRARRLSVESLDLRFSGSVVMKPRPDDEAGEAAGR